ncbi:hypothetical protein ACAX61_11265 [Sphingomonas sp. IW22]|jgi:hypothetical protein|uniref:hypothetical protein n=2 Tax=Sphingomonadaceae TaxID=41297 RepID=UPI001E2CA7F9|nr:hypothetical protein [Sphingobium sp. CECT 9361]CAH0350395.1 hypothetical protein SPH9361_01084 [Sphingobium sp. CECT 9361]
MNVSISRAQMGLIFSALLLSSGIALAQDRAAPPAKPMGGGMMGHDNMMPGMKDGKMKGNMPASSCMSKAGMQKMGMSQKKMAEMGAKCRAEKKRGTGAVDAKPKPDAMKPMPMEHDM